MKFQGAELTKGMQVTVYWSGDDQWYHATVIGIRKPRRVRVEYEDGLQEWIHGKTNEWKVWTKDVEKQEDVFQNKKKERVQSLMVGSRVAVFWPLEKEFFTGTIAKFEASNQCHLIRYEDGDEEWTNLVYRKFTKVISEARRIQVESRNNFLHDESDSVNVFSSASSTVSLTVSLTATGNVTQNPLDKPKPNMVKSDDDFDDKKHEGVDLKLLSFQKMNNVPQEQVPIVLKKRKREFLQDMSEFEIGQGWKARIKEEPVVPLSHTNPYWTCLSDSLDPSAISCHHIISCSLCAQQKYTLTQSHQCPHDKSSQTQTKCTS